MLSADTACSKNRMFIRQLMPLEYVFASLLDLDGSLVAKYNGLFQLEAAPIDPSMQRLVRTAQSRHTEGPEGTACFAVTNEIRQRHV